jgi:heme A synthase
LQKSLHAANQLYDAEGFPKRYLSSGNEILAWHVWLQMLHRLGALVTLFLAIALVFKTRQLLGQAHVFTKVVCMMLVMVIAQAGLGVWTLLSNKAADVATGHVLLGAVCLALSSLLLMAAKRCVFVAGLANLSGHLIKQEDDVVDVDSGEEAAVAV